MAQEPEEEFDGEGEPDFEGGGGGSSKKKLILLVVLPLVLVLGGGAAAYFTGLADPLIAMVTGKKSEKAAASEGKESKDGKEKKPEAAAKSAAGGGGEESSNAVFYDLPDMLVNINTAGRKRNFLKIRVSLELSNETDIAKVENVLPRIIDSFQVYLRELRLEDLQGAAGMFRLREELLNRVNASVRPVQVRDVLFIDMVVQ